MRDDVKTKRMLVYMGTMGETEALNEIAVYDSDIGESGLYPYNNALYSC